MRPAQVSRTEGEAGSSKQATTDHHSSVPPPAHQAPPARTTYFLTRDLESHYNLSDRSDSSRTSSGHVPNLQDFLDEAEPSSKRPRVLEGRRRSTIKPIYHEDRRRTSITQAHETVERPVTPSPLPSQPSLPASPKSVSSRSAPRSDDELISDDASSQAIASSEEDEDSPPPAVVHDSQPELIMPSIKMPSRRPFTDRGQRLGRFKILVAGRKGTGKTSLIKSIVQLCEDIVHVDPLSTSQTSETGRISETHASTRAYPSWWSDLDESRILKRRKSMGDQVLERNLCFVETASSKRLDHIVHYAEQQLLKAVEATNIQQHDFASMLSGQGGSQVDVVLYLVAKEHASEDRDRIRKLSEVCNVIALVSRSDILSPQELETLKTEVSSDLSVLPQLPPFSASDEASMTVTAPYAIACINGPDLDTIDASLLMSPEYVQPLLPSELSILVDNLFNLDTVAYLKHTSAKKLLSWHVDHPRLTKTPSASTAPSFRNSTLTSPQLTSMSNSGFLIPQGSELSLNTSNSYALAKVADHSQREERLAQIRLSKWASELQLSLQRERERYEQLARHERALWLLQKMGEEVNDGHIVSSDTGSQAMVRRSETDTEKSPVRTGAIYQMHDPLGLLQWRHAVRSKGWIALQVVGSVGVLGGLAFFWMAKTRGITSTIHDMAQSWASWLDLEY